MSKLDAGDWACIICAIAAILLLVSCGSATRSDKNGDLTRDERWTGTFDLKLPYTGADGLVGFRSTPITFDVTRTVSENSSESRNSTKTLQAPELAAALGSVLRTSFPALGMLGGPAIGAPAERGTDYAKIVSEILNVVLTGGLLHRHAAASRNAARAEAESKRAEEHKADAVEGWDKALQSSNRGTV